MVFQRPNRFPKSVFDNVAFGRKRITCATAADLAPGWSGRSSGQPCGRGPRSAGMSPAPPSRAASSSACAWPGRWQIDPDVCCSMNRAPPRSARHAAHRENLLVELKKELTIVHRDAQHAQAAPHRGLHPRSSIWENSWSTAVRNNCLLVAGPADGGLSHRRRFG